jgi:hypothetical protein
MDESETRLATGGAEVKRLKTMTSVSETNENLRRRILERKALESTLDPEAIETREKLRVYKDLPLFFDQVYTYLRARRLRSMKCDALAKEMADRSLNKRVHIGGALQSLGLLTEILPSYCEIKPNETKSGLFVTASLPKDHKAADLRSAVEAASKRLAESVLERPSEV